MVTPPAAVPGAHSMAVAQPPWQTPRSVAPPMATRLPAAAAGSAAANRAGGIYLPPMPEMLRAPAGPDFADGRSSAAAASGQAMVPAPPGQVPPKRQVPFRATHANVGKLELPAPEALGLLPRAAKPDAHHLPTIAEPALNWSVLRAELDRLHTRSFRLEKTASGAFRFTCTVAHPVAAGKSREFVAEAQSEDQAVRLVLTEIAQWQAQQLSASR